MLCREGFHPEQYICDTHGHNGSDNTKYQLCFLTDIECRPDYLTFEMNTEIPTCKNRGCTGTS